MINLQLKFIQDLEAESLQSQFDGILRKLTPAELKRYSQIHPDLRLLFDESRKELLLRQSVVKNPTDIYLVCGNRNKEDQTQAVAGGFSKVFWPNSKHNRGQDESCEDETYCSDAMDIAPFPIDWNDERRFKDLIQLVMSVAFKLEKEGRIRKIRFGADFNMDGNFKNDKFVDLPHVEVLV